MTPVEPGCLQLEGLFNVGLRGTTLACGSEGGGRGSMDSVMGRGNASCDLKIIRLTRSVVLVIQWTNSQSPRFTKSDLVKDLQNLT